MQRNLLFEVVLVGAIMATAYWLVCKFVRPGLLAAAMAGGLAHLVLELTGANAAFCAYASY